MSYLTEKDVTIKKPIGNGGFSIVYKGESKNGEPVAVKKVTLYPPTCLPFSCLPCGKPIAVANNSFSIGNIAKYLSSNKSRKKIQLVTYKMTAGEVLAEVQMLEQLRHEPFFLTYLGSYFSSNHLEFFVISELCVCNVRSLMKYEKEEIGSFPISLAFHFFIPVIEALSHLHMKDMIHRDIKEENILITANGTPKICDLGLALHCKRKKNKIISISAEKLVGTDWYMPPEIVRKERFNETVDTWSTALMLLSLMRGGNPFNSYAGDDVTLWQQNVVRFYREEYSALEKEEEGQGQSRFYKMAGIDLYASKDDNHGKNVKLWRLMKTIIREMLKVNYKERPSASEIFENHQNLRDYMELWHEYLGKGSVTEVEGIDKLRKFRKQFNKVVKHVDALLHGN